MSKYEPILDIWHFRPVIGEERKEEEEEGKLFGQPDFDEVPAGKGAGREWEK